MILLQNPPLYFSNVIFCFYLGISCHEIQSHSLPSPPRSSLTTKEKKKNKRRRSHLYIHWGLSKLSVPSPLEKLSLDPTSLPEAINCGKFHFNVLITIYVFSSMTFCLGCYFSGGRKVRSCHRSLLCLFLSCESAVINTMAKVASLPLLSAETLSWRKDGPST